MFEASIRKKHVVIHSTPDLIAIGKIYIYQMETDDKKMIVKFDDKEKSSHKKWLFISVMLFVFSFVLIYILNTDEVMAKQKRKKDKEEKLKQKRNSLWQK